MIIDFHSHVFPDAIAQRAIETLSKTEGLISYTKGTTASLLASSGRAKVNVSLLLPVVTKPTQTPKILDEVLECHENFIKAIEEKSFDESLIESFGGVHPDNENYKEVIDTLHSHGIKGIKLHPVFQDTCFDDIKYLKIIDYACEKNMLISVHAGLDVSMPSSECARPEHIIPVLKATNPDNIILAHMGAWNCWDLDIVEEMIGEYKPLLDTAFCLASDRPSSHFYEPLSIKRFRELVALTGADKVLFGTDSPWTDQKEALMLLKRACASDEDFDKISSINPCRLLGLENI